MEDIHIYVAKYESQYGSDIERLSSLVYLYDLIYYLLSLKL